MSPSAYGLGVDLGTTYTAAATWRDGRAESVPLGLRAHTVPSVLFLREDGVLLVGEAAARRGATEPERVAREFKRRFGDGIPLFLGDREVAVEELAGQLLRWVVETVTEREGAPPAHVTLTHPANWGRHRTELLVTAAEQAGLTDVGLLVEPVAAAAYYASTERLDTGRTLAVYDLGGGTFDATIVRKTGTGFTVVGEPSGDDGLGGVDFDQAVLDHVAGVLGPAWRALDLEDDAVLASLARLRAEAVDAKEALSVDVEASIPVLLPEVRRDVRITRGEFEAAVRIPLLRTVDLLAQAVDSAGVDTADLHAVLLIGGSSRIPLVSRLIATELGVPVALDAHPKYAVCLGAAIATGARLAPPPVAPDRPEPAPPPAPEPAAEPEPPPAPPAAEPERAAPVPAEPEPEPPRPAEPTARPAPHPTPRRPVPHRPVARPEVVPRPLPRPVVPSPRPAPARPGEPVAVPPARPAAAIEVDLQDAGITGSVDTAVPTTPEAPRWAPVIKAHDEPVTVTHVGDRGRGRRVALITTGSAVLVIALVTAVALLVGPRARVDAPHGPAGGSGSTAPAVATSGRATLVEQAVPGAAGSRMRAVTTAGDRAVAVGGSDTDGSPRAWRSDSSGAWSAAEVDLPATMTGGMNGVAGTGRGLVAVGWVAPRQAGATPAGGTRQAAVWTSADGARWALRTAGDLGTGSASLGELFDVAAAPSGGVIASGVDWSADPTSGDGVVLRSADGRSWERLPVTGLDGLGPATVRRVVPDGPVLLAVGSRLEAGSSAPVVWTSPDGRSWSEAAVLEHPGPGAAEATGIARLGGMLLVSGTATALDGSPVPVVWSGSSAEDLRPAAMEATGAALEALAVVSGRAVAVGARSADGGAVAAAWEVDVAP